MKTDEFNPNLFLSEFLVLSSEITVLKCSISLLETCRSLPLVGTPGPELRQIAVLLDSALEQSKARFSDVSKLMDALNLRAKRAMRAQRAVDSLTAPPASDRFQ
jgi:hypothetical protein